VIGRSARLKLIDKPHPLLRERGRKNEELFGRSSVITLSGTELLGIHDFLNEFGLIHESDSLCTKTKLRTNDFPRQRRKDAKHYRVSKGFFFSPLRGKAAIV
jgi:hypothetical protein